MGTPLIQQRRGKGSKTYRAPPYKFKPRLEYKNKNGRVVNIVRNPMMDAPLAKIRYEDMSTGYMVAPEGIRIGDAVEVIVLPLSKIPESTPIFCIETRPNSGPKLCRAPGTFAMIVSRGRKSCIIQLPSKKEKSLNPECRATLGVPAGGGQGGEALDQGREEMDCHACQGEALPQDLRSGHERSGPSLWRWIYRPGQAQVRFQARPSGKEGGVHIAQKDREEEMRQEIMELDYEGILPLDGEDEGKFYDRGSRSRDAALELKSKSDGLLNVNEELNEFEQTFKTRPKWISCKYKRLPSKLGGKMVRIKHNGLQIPTCEIQESEKAFPKPVKDFFEEIEKFLDAEISKDLKGKFYRLFYSDSIKHEMTHCVRYHFLDNPGFSFSLKWLVPIKPKKLPEEAVVSFLNDGSYSFKEEKRLVIKASIASAVPFISSIFRPYFLPLGFFCVQYPLKIGLSMLDAKSTHRALEDIKENAGPEFYTDMGYALLRMKPKEMRNLRDYFAEHGYTEEAFKDYMEERRNGDLRFNIMMERVW